MSHEKTIGIIDEKIKILNNLILLHELRLQNNNDLKLCLTEDFEHMSIDTFLKVRIARLDKILQVD